MPLGNGNVYIVYEISKDVEASNAPLVATFKIDDVEFTVDCRTAK